MEILLIIFIMFCLFLVLRSILNPLIKPFTNKQKERIKADEFYKNVQKKTFKDKIKEFAEKMPLLSLSEDMSQELKIKIERLQIDTTVEQIRKTQTLYLITIILVGSVLSIILGGVILIISLVLAFVAWEVPVYNIESEIRKRNAAVEAEIPKLFSVLYYVYKRTSSVNLKDKVQSYIKTSNDYFYSEMQLFINDCNSGEVYALKQLKKRIPIAVVMRFCDIMESRIVGNDNINVMQNFKTELDQKMLAKSKEILKETDKKVNAVIQLGIAIPFGLIMIVYFGVQLYTAVR